MASYYYIEKIEREPNNYFKTTFLIHEIIRVANYVNSL